MLQNAFILLFSNSPPLSAKFFWVVIGYTILLNFIQYFVSKFVMDGVNIDKLCAVINIILIVHLCFGSHSHGQFLKSIRSNSVKERNDSA